MNKSTTAFTIIIIIITAVILLKQKLLPACVRLRIQFWFLWMQNALSTLDRDLDIQLKVNAWFRESLGARRTHGRYSSGVLARGLRKDRLLRSVAKRRSCYVHSEAKRNPRIVNAITKIISSNIIFWLQNHYSYGNQIQIIQGKASDIRNVQAHL